MYGKIDGLTPKQRLFVDNYLISLNATESARLAGYSPRRASEIGYQLLRKTTVKEAIAMEMEKRSKRLKRSADDILLDVYQTGQEARAKGQYGVTLKALETEAKFLGLFDNGARDQEQALAKLDEVLAQFEGVI